MALSFALHGDAAFCDAVRGRLGEAGLLETSEASAADVVINFSVGESIVEDLYFGDNGFVQMLDAGTCIIDMSAVSPNFSRELSAVATVNDLEFVEAPLVVLDPAHKEPFSKDNLGCFLAGEDALVKKALPFVEAICGIVETMGVYGSAQMARAAYTIQIAAQMISAIEADALYRAVRRNPAGSAMATEEPVSYSKVGGSIMASVAERRFTGAYTVAMFMSELSCALTAADDAELILPQAEAAIHLLELLAVIGGADMAPASLALVYDDEDACAAAGLDWTRAEEAYGSAEGYMEVFGDEDYDDDFDDYDGFDDLEGFDGFDYSNN